MAWAFTTSHLPSSLKARIDDMALAPSPEYLVSGTKFISLEAATIPLAAMTASLALYWTLQLPQPWTPAINPNPLLVYGGSSAVGAFAIKLAIASNLHPIIAVAGAGIQYAVEKGTFIARISP